MTSSRRRKVNPSKSPRQKPPSLGKLPWPWIWFILGSLLYANTIPHEYTQDDAIVIYDNMFTQEGFAGIPGLLKYDTFYGFFKEEGKAKLVSGGRYRPLTPVLFAIEWQFFGRAPWLGHLLNAILYGITGTIVFLLLSEIGKVNFKLDKNLLFAVVGTALYVTHPIHTEAVANIKGRDEMLAFLFSVLSLLVLIRQKKLGIKHLILAGLFLFLGLMSKENAISMLAVIPVALWLKGKKIRSIAPPVISLFVAVALFLIIRGAVIGWDFGGQPKELMNNPFLKIENNQFVPFSFQEKSATILFTLGKYIQLMFFPHPLTHDYYPRHVEVMSLGNFKVILSALLYVAMIFLMYLLLKRRNVMGFGIFFFLASLFLVSNIVFPIGTNMSERFLYMPSLGFAITVAAGLLHIKALQNRTVLIICAVVSMLFIVKTVTRNTVWKDNYTLFTTDIETSRRSAKLLSATGGELQAQALKRQDESEKTRMISQSITYLKDAVAIHPNYKLAYLLLGNGHYYLKKYEEAIPYFQQVLRIDPDYEEGQKNIAVAYRDAGKMYGEERGDLGKAISYLLQAYSLLQQDYETVHALGVAYGLQGNTSKAIEFFKKGISFAPENATAYFNLGLAYQNNGDAENARIYYNKAIELDPEIANRRAKRN